MIDDQVLPALRSFVAERDWAQFHTAPNLAKGVSVDAAELLECYQWSDDADHARVREELADVLTYCLLLTDRIGADPSELVLDKLEQTKRKYPVELARGDITKHDRR